MGSNRPPKPVARWLPGDAPQAAWLRLATEAKIYASAGAWDAVRDHLWPHIQPYWLSTVDSPDIVEPIALLLVAFIHLDNNERVVEGTRWLNEILASRPNCTAEARALALVLIARARIEEGDYPEARRVLDGADRIAVSGVTPWTLSRARIVRARLEAREGNLVEAERAGLEAVTFAEKSNSDALIGDSLNILATILRFQRRIDAAQRLYARSATCYWRSGDATGRVSALINRAALLNGMGLLRESAAIFREAHNAAVAVGREIGVMRANLGKGWVAARGGELDVARRVLLSVWRQARRLGAHRDEALALEYLAQAYLLSGDLRKTRLAVHGCKRLAQTIAPEGDIAIEISISESLLFVAEGNNQAATVQARRAIKRARRAGLPWEEVQAHRVLGTALARSGRRREALASFAAAHEILQRIGEQLEKRLVEAWIEALTPREEKETPSRRRVSGDEGPAEIEGAKFWIEHPLLGPSIILQRARARRRGARLAHVSGAGNSNQTRSGISLPTVQSGVIVQKERVPQAIWADLGLVTRSPVLQRTLLLAETFAPGPFPILILGETGTGKELLAQGLHSLSRLTGRFVPVNCAAAHREIFLAELFGARKGAFTGALEERHGLIQEAEGGTIFFDEIADLDPAAQGFLLRFLDSGEVRPLGAAKSVRVTTRVVTATCRDLQGLVVSGAFRRDLYARLVASVLPLPSLKDRLDDLELLAHSLWLRMHGDPMMFARVFTPQIWPALRERPWPGNVRDLVHIVGRALLFVASLGPEAASEHILENAGRQWNSGNESYDAGLAAGSGSFAHGATARGFERSAATPGANQPRHKRGEHSAEEFAWALRAAGGSIAEAARLLGISRSHAYRLYKAQSNK